MKPPKPANSDSLMVTAKFENLRSDQRGSVTLLAGMMVFLVTIFGVVAMDTNMAIHNRIVAQNAVDSAADSAALWQARFCNVEQLLNNLHYTVDEVAAIAEGVATGFCIASVPLEVIKDIPFCEEVYPVWVASCVVCMTLPFIDKVQHLFYDALMPVQQRIVDAAPFIVFGYANANAYGSGADEVILSGTQWFGEMATKAVGIFSSSGANELSSTLGTVNNAVGGVLKAIPIYAIPLNPDRLSLHVHTNENNGFPLSWPSEVPMIGDAAGNIGCAEMDYSSIADDGASYTAFEGDDNRDGNDEHKPKWGWNDLYYKGNPGYMTWVAGVTSRNELLGLGNLAWLNGGMKDSDYTKNGDQASKVMWNGSVIGNSGNYSGDLKIPAFLAIASSQVEGHPVICNGDADAKPYLITVTLPFPSNNTNSAKSYFIFH